MDYKREQPGLPAVRQFRLNFVLSIEKPASFLWTSMAIGPAGELGEIGICIQPMLDISAERSSPLDTLLLERKIGRQRQTSSPVDSMLLERKMGRKQRPSGASSPIDTLLLERKMGRQQHNRGNSSPVDSLLLERKMRQQCRHEGENRWSENQFEPVNRSRLSSGSLATSSDLQQAIRSRLRSVIALQVTQQQQQLHTTHAPHPSSPLPPPPPHVSGDLDTRDTIAPSARKLATIGQEAMSM